MWIYNGQEFTSEMIEDNVGFVYIVFNTLDDTKYIGKKIFWNKVTKPPLKGKTRRRISKKESNWKDYYGSGPAILKAIDELGKENFSRKIIRLCKTKSEMSYYETKQIFVSDALISEEYYNEWCSVKVTGKFVKS